MSLRNALVIIYPGKTSSDFARLGRGFNILMKSLKERDGQEKLHQAVRCIEGLILPEIGNTKKQFVHRCQTFAKANQYAQEALAEIFDMRSDAEHVHDWSNSLGKYDAAKRDDIAWHRTRQIERLACFAYARIMLDPNIRKHFQSESRMEDFWKKLNDSTRRTLWGAQLDLASMPLVQDYFGSGAAK